MDCEERQSLLRKYDRATVEASNVAKALAKVAGTSPLNEYLTILDQLTEAESAASKARAAYDKHIIEHRCVLKE